MVYEIAREYLRDHPKAHLNARELAHEISEDERLVEMLMLEGRFENSDDGSPEESDAEKKRRKLLEDLEKNLSSSQQKPTAAATYGSDRHGVGRDR
jgi:arylamine N-acetyltransferase